MFATYHISWKSHCSNALGIFITFILQCHSHKSFIVYVVQCCFRPKFLNETDTQLSFNPSLHVYTIKTEVIYLPASLKCLLL